ncbi:MAG: DUF4276 family protein [Candidatus Latescibacterota bacterium]
MVGQSKSLRIACRQGFRKLLEKAGLAGRMPRIVACGRRQDALDDFGRALLTGDSHPVLLVDAEAPVTAISRPWEHLQARDGWVRPAGATDEQGHLMVQAMESWFLADRPALAAFYGQHYREGALPDNPDVESVAKAGVLHGLEQATRDTRKGRYAKGALSYDVLGRLDPARLEAAAPAAKRLFATLRRLVGVAG